MALAKLRRELTSRGAKTGGNTKQLRARLAKVLADEQQSALQELAEGEAQDEEEEEEEEDEADEAAEAAAGDGQEGAEESRSSKALKRKAGAITGKAASSKAKKASKLPKKKPAAAPGGSLHGSRPEIQQLDRHPFSMNPKAEILRRDVTYLPREPIRVVQVRSDNQTCTSTWYRTRSLYLLEGPGTQTCTSLFPL